jgi:hypothetical protein
MEIFEFDVEVSTHDLLRLGILVADQRRVTVLGSDYSDASLAAYAMACVDGAVVTGLWVRI